MKIFDNFDSFDSLGYDDELNILSHYDIDEKYIPGDNEMLEHINIKTIEKFLRKKKLYKINKRKK